MKRLAYIIFAAGVFASCTKDFTKLNTDPNKFSVVSPESSIETAVRSLNIQMANLNMSKYWDLANEVIINTRYDVTDAGLWQQAYVNVLENLTQVINSHQNDSAFNNRVQIARILQCYTYSILVGQFGPIARSQANNPDNLSTILFDSEDSVYGYILNNLKDAAAKIKPAGDKLTYDVVYPGGTPTNWIKFANTLRLKIALRCMRNLGTVATAHIQDVMANEAATISAESETAKMAFENVTNNQNPYWIKFVQSGGYYPYKSTATGMAPKLSDHLLAFFRSYNDPRLSVYFDSVPVANRYIVTDTVPSTTDDSIRVVTYPIPYFGLSIASIMLPGWTATQGVVNPLGGNNNNTYSNISSAIVTDPARPFIMLSYAEAQFCKAEAAYLGLGGTSTADQYYYSGIDANFAFWGINSTLRDAYKTQDGIKWGTAGTGYNDFLSLVNMNIPLEDINKIWTQRWLNYFPDQPFDFWCLERRTRVLNFVPCTNPGGFSQYAPVTTYMDIPGRGSYPTNPSVANLNPNGYASALKELGVTNSPNDYDPTTELRFALPYKVPDWNAAPARFDTRFIRGWYGGTYESLQAAAAGIGFKLNVTQTYHP